MSENAENPKPGGTVQDVRAQVRAAIDARGLTQTGIAREAGIAPTTLSEFLAGRYTGNNSVIAAKLTSWLKALADRAAVPSALVGTPDFVETSIAVAVLDALDYARIAGNLVVVIGEPGVGKTTALAHYRESTNNVWLMTASSDTAALVPMLDELSLSVGVEPTSHGGAAGLRRAIERKIRDTRGVLVVDEGQHLDFKAMESLRSIHDRTRIGLVIAGHPDLEENLRRSPQANSRVSRRVVLRQPTRSDVVEVAAVVAGEHLPIGDREVDYLLAFAQLPGGLRWVVNILKMALYLGMGMQSVPKMELLKNATVALNIGDRT